MSGKNEDSIEKFFRKGVRQNDTTFRESDWLALEKRLDEHAQAQAAARAALLRQMATGGAGILLIFLSLYFLLPDRAANTDRQATVNAEKQTTDHGSQTTVEDQTTAHGSQATVEDKSTGKGSQSMVNSRASAVDPSATNHSNTTQDSEKSVQQAASSPGSGAQTPLTQSGHVPQQPAGGSSTGVTSRNRATSANKEIQIAGVQKTAEAQPINTTRKPRLLKRSEATAASTPVSLHPTVATASERPARVTASPATTASPDRDANRAVVNAADGLVHPTDEPLAAASQPITTPPAADRLPAHPATTGAAEAGEASTADSRLDQDKRGQPIVDHGLSTVDRGLSTVDAPSADTVQADTTARQAPLAKQPAAAEEQKKNDKPRIPSRWSVALVVAPDFSTTGLGAEMSKPGTAFGGMIGYRLSRKFTIASGVIRSSKKYTGYGKDYTPPEGYWIARTNGVVPDEIYGSCTVVEVPVNVQFDLWHNPRSRLYIAGGVSSYFMRREAYAYSFDQPNDGADRYWSSSRPSTFAFKVGNLSAAYEIMLTKNFGVSVEPYFKIPFQGIGWANLSLYTTGAYINARYFFLKKNLE